MTRLVSIAWRWADSDWFGFCATLAIVVLYCGCLIYDARKHHGRG